MNILLDMQNLEIVYKHESIRVLECLSHLEFPTGVFKIGHYDTLLKGLTELDLKLLYRKCYSLDGTLPTVDEMREQLGWFCEAMDEFDCDEYEVVAQAACITDRNSYAYVYVKGSYRPAVKRMLFENPTTNKTLHESNVKPLDSNKGGGYTAPNCSTGATVPKSENKRVVYDPVLNNPFKRN